MPPLSYPWPPDLDADTPSFFSLASLRTGRRLTMLLYRLRALLLAFTLLALLATALYKYTA